MRDHMEKAGGANGSYVILKMKCDAVGVKWIG